jgi:DNA-binding GntR family transcriptional regulator
VEEAEGFCALCASLAADEGLPADPDARFLELRRRNRRRYEMLHSLARSPLSTDSGETYWDRSDFFLRVTFGGRDLPGFVPDARAALVDAVVAGDGQTAEHVTRHYLVRLGREVADVLERQAPEQPRR